MRVYGATTVRLMTFASCAVQLHRAAGWRSLLSASSVRGRGRAKAAAVENDQAVLQSLTQGGIDAAPPAGESQTTEFGTEAPEKLSEPATAEAMPLRGPRECGY
jgi:hypothetical protein